MSSPVKFENESGMKAMDAVARRVREGVLRVLKTVDLLAMSSGQE